MCHSTNGGLLEIKSEILNPILIGLSFSNIDFGPPPIDLPLEKKRCEINVLSKDFQGQLIKKNLTPSFNS